MIQRADTHRRAYHGTMIVRASMLAVGLAASVGVQFAQPEQKGAASWADHPSLLCGAGANASFAFQ